MGSFVVAAGLALVGGCKDPEPSCYFDGRKYGPGDSYENGSTECICNEDGSITCSEKPACATGACCSGGKSYQVGEDWPNNDAGTCGTCACIAAGAIQCFSQSCATSCLYGGVKYPIGESFPTSDGCNTCTCAGTNAGAQVVCTELPCFGCTYAGKSYNTGDSFPATDGCNTCTCNEDGVVSCTEIACP
ncbi:MAG: hypothetical protein EXR75_00465 [Myxococcales bacterium]|nr:hypothetical protein [Myxococcales bacterium]